MLLSMSLLSKGSTITSLLSKFRQVLQTTPTNYHKKDPTNNLTSPSPCSPLPAHATAGSTIISQNSKPSIANLSLTSSTTAGVRTIEEKIGLPPRPKKPLTPYFRFMREMRPKLFAENPKVTAIEATKVLSKQWESADPKLKEHLQEEYKRDQQIYVERRAKYDSKITDEQRAEIKQIKMDLAEAKERKLMRKKIKELGRPKRPASAFLKFISAERVATPQLPKQTYKEWHKKCTAKWARLSDEEKSSYMQEARKELEKYKDDINLWEEKMIRLGHIDVVRSGNLIDPPEPKLRSRK